MPSYAITTKDLGRVVLFRDGTVGLIAATLEQADRPDWTGAPITAGHRAHVLALPNGCQSEDGSRLEGRLLVDVAWTGPYVARLGNLIPGEFAFPEDLDWIRPR